VFLMTLTLLQLMDSGENLVLFHLALDLVNWGSGTGRGSATILCMLQYHVMHDSQGLWTTSNSFFYLLGHTFLAVL